MMGSSVLAKEALIELGERDSILKLIREGLASQGYVYLSGMRANDLEDVLRYLGEVIQITNIRVDNKSRALLASERGLDFHTDHSKADIVAWYCFGQANSGGESMLLDIEQILPRFSEEETRILSSIMLHEHKVFDDDEGSYPLIEKTGDKFKCYYSFWLVKRDLSKPQRFLLDKFQRIIRETKPRVILLQPKDILLVDNGRILHGRKPIEGGGNRFLKRYWISCSAVACP